MAKEFKQWDTMFTSQELHEERKMWSRSSACDIGTIEGWSFNVGVYSNAEIREAVYFAEDAKDWQRFRVSMKGLSTKHKLCMLMYRLNHVYNGDDEAFRNVKAFDSWKRREQCRIDNYVGALVRGGQLSPTDYRIVK